MSDDRPIRYEEDGRTIYRASGLYMCDRLFVAIMQNYTLKAHPAWFQEILDEGSRSEASIVAMYEAKNEGTEIVDSQRVVEIEVLDGVFIRGSIDGLVGGWSGAVEAPAEVLFEAKKFRESTWMKFMRSGVECMPWYPWQVSAYMHGLGVDECEFTGGLYKDGEIIDVYTHHLASPPIPLKGLVKRVAKLESLFNDGALPHDVACIKPAMYPCPVFYLHDTDDLYEPPERIEDEQMLPMLVELAELKAEATPLNKALKENEARKKEINQALLAFMEANGVDDDDERLIGDQIVKWHRTFNPGTGPYDYVRVTTKKAPVKKGKKGA